ncbi:hypothetical protein AHAS_Ahas04G0134900 [Arachis hypogaea]
MMAMKRRLATSEANIVVNPCSKDKIFSSATVSNIPSPPKFNTGVDPKVHDLDDPSPTNSPKKKKQKKGKVHIEITRALSSTSFGCILEKEFQAPKFIDEHLMTDEAKSGLVKLPSRRQCLKFKGCYFA